ncbi:MAG: glucosyltransferase domain-containing protein [Firmicutes bacterium]|nr:glucosyltransferase domain-containing protein [Bacillota bacterium]
MFDVIYYKLQQLFKSQTTKIAVLIFVIALCYGYEFFNLNLTIDEELNIGSIGAISGWVAQARWGMWILGALVMPATVVPTVSVLVGVCFTLLAVYFIIMDAFQLDDVAATFVAALVITIPSYCFIFTFSTIAYGIGVGFATLSIAYFLVRSGGWYQVAIAAMLAGFSIGIYQSFIIVIFLIACLIIWIQIELGETKFIQYALIKPSVLFFGGIVVYILVDKILRAVLGIELDYVGQFINFGSFFQSPWQYLLASIKRIVDLVGLSSDIFGLHSFWLIVAMFLALFILIFKSQKQNSLKKNIVLALFILLAWVVCVFADAVSIGSAPIRAFIYLPVVIGFTLAAGYCRAGKSLSFLLSVIVILAIVSNSVISNHLFASNAYAAKQDAVLATEIIQEVGRLQPDLLSNNTLKLELVGEHGWPVTSVMTKSETFGASFFEWDGGNRYRVAAYLRTWGLNTVVVGNEERLKIRKYAQEMHCWPTPGWVSIHNGILIVKLSDYTPFQDTQQE